MIGGTWPSRPGDRPTIKAVGLDLDGVVYLGDDAIPGAAAAVATLRNRGRRVLLLTNNSARTRPAIAAKLASLGIPATELDIVSSAWAAARHLQATSGRVAVVGTEALRQELRTAGIAIVPFHEAETLLVGYKPDFSYADVRDACQALDAGAQFVACNTERRYPVADGTRLPGCGPGVAAIAHAAERAPDFVVGKPSAYYLKLALETAEVAREEMLIVGDSWASDIEMAISAGCPAAFIAATGSVEFLARRGDVAVYPSLAQLVGAAFR